MTGSLYNINCIIHCLCLRRFVSVSTKVVPWSMRVCVYAHESIRIFIYKYGRRGSIFRVYDWKYGMGSEASNNSQMEGILW